MFVLFPFYQILAFNGVVAIAYAIQEAGSGVYMGAIALILAIFIGVPIVASWHLSCFLFAVGYFGFFAWLGIPLMAWVTRQLERIVNLYRPENDPKQIG